MWLFIAEHWCDKINATCSLPDIRYMVKTQPPKPPIIKYKPQYIIEYLRSPTKHPNDHKFAEGVGVGFAVMLLLALLVFFVIFVRHRRSRREKITQGKQFELLSACIYIDTCSNPIEID